MCFLDPFFSRKCQIILQAMGMASALEKNSDTRPDSPGFCSSHNVSTPVLMRVQQIHVKKIKLILLYTYCGLILHSNVTDYVMFKTTEGFFSRENQLCCLYPSLETTFWPEKKTQTRSTAPLCSRNTKFPELQRLMKVKGMAHNHLTQSTPCLASSSSKRKIKTSKTELQSFHPLQKRKNRNLLLSNDGSPFPKCDSVAANPAWYSAI